MENIKTFYRELYQLKQILDKQDRNKVIFIVLLSFISAFLEMLGVSAILPLVLALLKPETLNEYVVVQRILSFFHITSNDGMVIFVALGVMSVFVIKNVFLLMFGYYKNRFNNRLEQKLSTMMFETYIGRPYEFFLHTSTIMIERGVTSDITGVSNSVGAFCNLFNELLTCGMLGIALLVINPTMAISIGVIAGVLIVFMIQILRKRIGRCGEQTRLAFLERGKVILETVGGIKEINVMKRQHMFSNKFEKSAEKVCAINTEYQTCSMIPSRVTETTFIIGLLSVVLVAYVRTDNASIIIAQISALALAAIRILPSITNISNAMNTLIFFRQSLENAYDNIVLGDIRDEHTKYDISETEETKSAFERDISIDNISWKYADNLPNVIDGLSLKIKKGEAIGLIGESGAGKTTLADIILGLYEPQSGSVTVDGKSIFGDQVMWNEMIGYVPQNIFLMDNSIRNNILFGIDEADINEGLLSKAICQAQMTEFINKLPEGINTVLGERGVKISGGQRQRIAIARALYYNPDVLVLDEATSALDNETESAVIEAIEALQGEKTLIIVAHRLSTIANCDRIFEIKKGKAIERNKAEVIQNGR